MRPSRPYRILFALPAVLGFCAANAAQWDSVVHLSGQRIDLDKSRLERLADGRATAWSRLALGRDFIDENGMRYTDVEALNRYDCEKHAFATLKRVYRRDGKLVRNETIPVPREIPAESGSADDTLLAAVCKAATARGHGAGLAVTDTKATAMYADVRSAETAAAKPTHAADKPGESKAKAAESKPAADAADKAAEAKAPRPNYIDLPKIDKSKLEDPNAAPAKAETKDAKDSKTAAKPAPTAPAKSAERPAASDRITSYRAELERQYASSGPRRAPKAKPAEPAVVVEHREIHWSYEGEGAPANWGKLRPDYATCAAGKRQSPIDIRDTIKVDLDPILFDYKRSNFSVIDNGHTIQVNISEGSAIHIMEQTYELVQFHFHKPSEERINGRAFDMVVHLVHRDVAGRLAVIAVPLEKGGEHPLVQTIWNNLPLDRDIEVSPSWQIDPSQLLPPPERRAYYAYMGSLTTPPCTEDVLWLVLKQPVQVSPQQIGIFSRLYMNNARPIQASNGRLVKENR